MEVRNRAWLCAAVVKDIEAMGIKEEAKRTRGGSEEQSVVVHCRGKGQSDDGNKGGGEDTPGWE